MPDQTETPNPDVVALLWNINAANVNLIDVITGKTRQLGDRLLTDYEVTLAGTARIVDLDAVEHMYRRDAEHEQEMADAAHEFNSIAKPYFTGKVTTVDEALARMPAAKRKRCNELSAIFAPDGYIWTGTG